MSALNSKHIEFAFNEIRQRIHSGPSINWSDIQHFISSEGESIAQNDLTACMTALIGGESASRLQHAAYTSIQFADQILGFETLGA